MSVCSDADELATVAEGDPVLPVWNRWLEPAIVAATLPLALFAERLPAVVCVVVIGALGALWILRLLRRNGRMGTNYLSLPMYALVLVFLPLSIWISPLSEVTIARTTLSLWSLGLFSWIANDTGPNRWKLVTWLRLFVGLGAAAALIGLFGMNDESLIPAALRWLPETLTYRGGVPANEMAGVLLIFLAPTLGMVFVPRKLLPLPRRLLILVVVLEAGVLVATKSRGGLLGAALSVAVLAGVMGSRGTLVAMLVAALGSVCVMLALWSDPNLRIFFLGGTLQGASVDTFFSGRFSIWEEALWVIGDAPFTGLGLGTFGSVMDSAFSVTGGARQLEDAHQQFLQAGTDFGVVGGVCWIALWLGIFVMLVKLRQRLRSGKLPHYLAAGLMAGFVGFVLFNLLDSVSPGWAGQIGFWFMAGLAVRMRRQVMGKVASRGWLPKGLVPVVCGVALAVAVAVLGGGGISGNGLALRLHRQLLHPSIAAPEVTSNARANFLWLSGLAKYRAGNIIAGEKLWLQLVAVSPKHWRHMRSNRPLDLVLAEAALATDQDNAEAHFWVSAALEENDVERSIAVLRSGLSLAPDAGREWLRLGEFLTRSDRPGRQDEALLAYANACRHGDPGANGCVRAGGLAEQLGRAKEAVDYYRMSNWEVGRRRLLELDPSSAQRPAMSYVWGVLALLLFGLAGWMVRTGILTR